MIIDAIVQILMTLFTGVLALFPTFTMDASGLGASLGNALAGANSVFPVVTLGICIMVVLSLRFFILVVGYISWIWDKVPFKFS